jgi:hypothetical protein
MRRLSLSFWTLQNLQVQSFLLLPIPFREFVLDDMDNGIETRVGDGRLAFYLPDSQSNGGYFRPLSNDDLRRYRGLGWSESAVDASNQGGLLFAGKAVDALQSGNASFGSHRWKLCKKQPGFLRAENHRFMARVISSRLQ